MIDSFVLLAPIYLLGVIALLGFVGCNWVHDLDETQPLQPPEAPTNLIATAGDAEVRLTWDPIPGATEFHVFRATISGTVAADYPVSRIVQLAQIPYTDDIEVANGTTYFYRVSAVNSAGEGGLSDEEDAMPTWPFGPFVNSPVTGATTLRPGENKFFGMEIEVGEADLTIQTLGRAFTPGLTGIHEVRLADGQTKMTLGHALVDMNSPADGDFKYAPMIPGPFEVKAGLIYYIVSQEFTGGDQFFDQNTVVSTRTEAKVKRAVYSDAPLLYVGVGGDGQTYGPVSFQY